MYHICPARCQIQFVHGKGANGGKGNSAFLSAGFGAELAAAVFGRFPRVNEADNPPFGDRLFDLDVAENDLSGLVGERKRGNCRLGEKRLDPGSQRLRGLGLVLERPAEGVALYRFGDRIVRRGKPNAAPRQLFLEVRDDHPIGAEHKADQLVLGSKRTGDRTAADGVRRLAILLSLRRRLPQRPGLLASPLMAYALARLTSR